MSIPIDIDKPVFRIEEISELEVENIINSLRNSKAKDAFGLDSTFFKTHKQPLIKPLTHLINFSINQGIFPNSWKTAVVTPIFKAGDKTLVENYRPISILPVISKVAEKWVAKQLTHLILIHTHLSKGHTPLHPMQFGFRSNHSTETANCFFIENIKINLDKGGIVGAIFLDLKKVFDTVDHDVLLSKLSYFNFSGDAIKWMKSYLTDKKQSTRINNTLHT